LEKACETAISYGAFRLKTLRQLLARKAVPQMPLPFLVTVAESASLLGVIA
jgi:hypothetical protein